MKKIFFVILIFFNIITFAQEKVKFSAQIRPRWEFDDRDFNSKKQASSVTYLRSRLGLTFTPSADISGFVQVQDSRLFGSATSTTADMKNVDLHQAYFKIDNFFNLPVDLKIGRMEMLFGNERFIGTVNWGNVGRSFDGTTVTIKGEKVKADFFAMKEAEKQNLGDTLDQNIYGVYTDLLLVKNHKIQPFLIWQRIIPSSLLDRFTTGAYVKGDIGSFTYEAEFAYQFGEFTTGGKIVDISAMMFAFNANYNFDADAKPFIGAGIDYISGDDNNADNKFKVYNTLYGTGHKFFGFMDYFINMLNDTYGLGITDLSARCGFTPISNLRVTAFLHVFSSNNDYKLKSGSVTNSFGTEFDLLMNYKYNDNVNFEGGFSLFSPGDIFKEKRGIDLSTWAYLMAVVNF